MVTPVRVYDISEDKNYEGMIVNVSAGGLGLLMEEALQEGAPIAVEFELPPRMVLRHLQAHVVRVHRVGLQYMVGIQFYRLPQVVEEDFERFVALHAKGLEEPAV